MKKKLALQQLIDKLTEMRGRAYPNYLAQGIRDGLDGAIVEARELLSVEREEVIDAFNQGYREGEVGAKSGVDESKDVSEFDDANIYIKNTFEQ